MSSLQILAPLAGVGIGMAAAYGVKRRNRRIHFVEQENLQNELDHFDIDVGPAETCVECGDELEPDDVGAVVRVEGEYKLVCQKPTCLDTYDIE